MTASRLRLNPSKTPVMWLGSSQQLDKINIRDVPLLSASVTVVNTARDLGVIFDSQLSLDAHVASVCRSSYYQLKQLRPVARSLSVEAAKTLVQAFVSSRLDYCNTILHGLPLPEKLMRRLQSVQNAAARMITSARRRDHIKPILRQLHWIPVRQRVDFKIAVLVFQCLTGHAPAYLDDDCQLAADASAGRLRSADTAKCVVRRTYNFGDRCFAAARPRLWNMLPLNLRLCDSLGQFKRSLKTFLFEL